MQGINFFCLTLIIQFPIFISDQKTNTFVWHLTGELLERWSLIITYVAVSLYIVQTSIVYHPDIILFNIFNWVLVTYLALRSFLRLFLVLASMLCTFPAGQYFSLPEPVRWNRLATAFTVFLFPSLLYFTTFRTCVKAWEEQSRCEDVSSLFVSLMVVFGTFCLITLRIVM